MTEREPDAGSSVAAGAAIPGEISDRVRERDRTVVRRRRRSGRRRNVRTWRARAARRAHVRTLLLSAGVLLLMAVGLYFGLARQEAAAPSEGSSHAHAPLIALVG
jgi:hypothetical protein